VYPCSRIEHIKRHWLSSSTWFDSDQCSLCQY